MKIEAMVINEPRGAFSTQSVEIDDPRPDEILVRIAGVGLCHTDIDASGGAWGFSFPAVLGHEGSGVDEKVGADVKKVAVGDRVVLTFRSCGECKRCAAGEPAYCHFMPALNYVGARSDGSKSIRLGDDEVTSNFFGQSSFATYALAYERNVVRAPEGAPLEILGPLGCGVQTGAGGIMRSLACEAGSSLVIAGGGAVGLGAVMGAVVQGCSQIIVVEPYEQRRALAREFGATHVIDPKATPDLAAAVREIVPIGVDYAFDTTGRPELLQALMDCLGPHGTLGVVGIPPPDTPVPGNMLKAITFGHSVKGIIEGDSDPDTFIPEMIALHQAGRLPFDRLVRTYRFSEINQAIRDQHAGECVKVVLIP